MNNILNKPIREKNLMIAEHLYPMNGWHIDTTDPFYPEILHVRYKEDSFYKQINYYKNIADLWPEIVKREITLHRNKHLNQWEGYQDISGEFDSRLAHFTCDENPQHALADCLLLVLIAEKEAYEDDPKNSWAWLLAGE